MVLVIVRHSPSTLNLYLVANQYTELSGLLLLRDYQRRYNTRLEAN